MLEYPRDEAKTLVKLALENTDTIKTYFDSGPKIIGKTGPHTVGVFSLSYGEKLVIEIPEVQSSDDETRIEVSGERVFGFNAASDPDKIESEFTNELSAGRGRDIDELIKSNQNIDSQTTKEVSSPGDQAGFFSFLS